MKISDALMSDLETCVRSLDCNSKPVVIAAHASWLREIADKVEAEVKAQTEGGDQ